jgi:Ca2+-binding RTX toxin-like protein
LSNSSDSNKSFKGKTMTVTISFASLSGPSGASFNPAVTTSVAAFLNANPTVPISISATGLTADNLTSLGLLTAGGNTAWRIQNFGSADSATLSRFGGGFTPLSLSLPANSFTFVRGGAAGTYILSGGIVNTKASGPQIVSTIAPLGLSTPYFITGSNFNDTLVGGQNTDTLIGGLGNDSLNGQQQNDLLQGGGGNDTLQGGGQNDTLIGGAGNDTLTGDGGADRFVFTNEGLDTVTVFNTTATGGLGPDVFAITSSAYLGAPAPGAAVVSTAAAAANAANSIVVDTLASITGLMATKSNIRFAFATDTKTLLYDNDGDWSTSNPTVATVTSITGTLVSGNFAFI